jgi:hypothetical protein
MLVAQLHGKLTRDEERSGNLLTSNVFRAFDDSGRAGALYEFLAGAILAGVPFPTVTGAEKLEALLAPLLREIESCREG